MLGYVTIEKNELKVREFDMYQAYYCGICKSIGRRFGQLPRMVLSYDSVFLALVLAGLSEETDIVLQEHCITHHIKKKPVVFGNEALDYAADVMVILAYHKFLDDWKDERPGRQKRSCASLSKITGDSSGGLPKNGRVFSCTFCPGAAAFRQDGPDSGYFCRHHGDAFYRIRSSRRLLARFGAVGTPVREMDLCHRRIGRLSKRY